MNHKILHLLQLSDSALPIGGFVFSQGMESAWKHGLITTIEDARRYLKTYLEQVVSFDLPFVQSAYDSAGELDKLDDLTEAYEAMLMNPLLHKSSAVMGRNLMSLLLEIKPTAEVSAAWRHFTEGKKTLHFSIAFGIVCRGLGLSGKEWMYVYLYTCIRDQVSAMTRLGIVGSRGGQELLSMILQEGKEIMAAEIVSYEKASKTGYMIDMAQLNHTQVYSKLFQN